MLRLEDRPLLLGVSQLILPDNPRLARELYHVQCKLACPENLACGTLSAFDEEKESNHKKASSFTFLMREGSRLKGHLLHLQIDVESTLKTQKTCRW